MYKVAVIGAPDTVAGFRALGLEVFPVPDPADAKKILGRLTAPDAGYAVIYMEEDYALPLSAELAKFTDKPIPAVIMIPGRGGSSGAGLAALHDAVRRAIGTDILGARD